METMSSTIQPIMAPPAIPSTNNGRDKVHWSQEVWDRIDMAVHEEALRIRVAAKFLPLHLVPPKTMTVPADLVIIPTTTPRTTAGTTQTLTTDEGAATRLIEISDEF